MITTDRASLDEVRDFANKVRKAGGGNPLDALMPAVPSDANQCLIAKNLNFNCAVNKPDEDGPWMMHVDDEKIARNISEALDLELIYQSSAYYYSNELAWALVLPDNIGAVAYDFDKAFAIAEALKFANENWEDFDEQSRQAYNNDWVQFAREEWEHELRFDWNTGIDLDLVEEMWPYIEESFKEAKSIGIFNEKGELIL